MQGFLQFNHDSAEWVQQRHTDEYIDFPPSES
jgi:hypothetical protein